MHKAVRATCKKFYDILMHPSKKFYGIFIWITQNAIEPFFSIDAKLQYQIPHPQERLSFAPKEIVDLVERIRE
jgi:hypothetical protein